MGYNPQFYVRPEEVFEELNNYILADGFDMILDLEKSQGFRLVEARTGKDYLDFFTFFASVPLGLNHPKMLEPSFVEYIGKIALNKISNSDIYTDAMATFIKTFFKVAVPKEFKYSFFIEGGALAVTNALKAAFDWKVQKNFAHGYKEERGTKIIHFKEAFHGRDGYTMSLTNTDPNKVKLFPKFDWPRVTNPKITFPLNHDNLAKVIELENQAIMEIKQAYIDNIDDIAAIIIEPIQSEGGDNHFRPEFLKELKNIAHKNDSLLIFDEVQTGFGLTGSMWVCEQLEVIPDILCFGKKMQVCGILATNRVDEVPTNVFKVSSRINSTWGGNLVDMVRATRYLEIIEEENLLENVKTIGIELMTQLTELEEVYSDYISQVRGRGMFAAFNFDTAERRNNFVKKCFDYGLIILPCGSNSLRFRPPLNLSKEELYEGMTIIRIALKDVV